MTQLLKHGLLVLVSLLDKNTLAKGNACFLQTNGGALLIQEHRVNNAAWSSNQADMASCAPTVAVKALQVLLSRFRDFALSACSTFGKVILTRLQSRFHPI